MPDNGSTIMIVTPAFQMPRLRYLYERQGIAIFPYAVDFQSRSSWTENLIHDPLNYVPTANGLYKIIHAVREAFRGTIYISRWVFTSNYAPVIL